MRKVLAALVIALVPACGGDEADDGSHEVGDVWTRDGLICARYEPHPQTHPGMAFTDCVPEGEPAFCWRTDDEVDCNEGSVHIGCVYLTGDHAEPGSQSAGCRLPHDCIRETIDNPDCCGAPPDDRVASWDCPTS